MYRQSKSKSDSGSRLEDGLPLIKEGMFKNIGSQWDDMKVTITEALKLLHTSDYVSNLTYLLRDPMENKPAGENIDIIADPYNGEWDEMLRDSVAIHYVSRDPPIRCEIPDTAVDYVAQRARCQQDSARLYAILVTMTKGQSTADLTKRFKKKRDGIGCYHRLKVAAEGSSASTTKINKAHRIIATTTYSGKSPRFTFANYVERLEGAFSTLADEGDPVSEQQKVFHLLTQISDPKLTIAKGVVQGDPAKMKNFLLAHEFLGTYLANQLHASSDTRNVAKVEGEKKGATKQGSDTETKGDTSGIEWRSGRFIPPGEYAKMLPWEKSAHAKVVKSLTPEQRKKLRASSKKRKGDGKKGREASSVDSGTGTDGTTTVPDEPSAGDQFGRSSHKKTKKAVKVDETKNTASDGN